MTWWFPIVALAGPGGPSDVPEQAILRPDDSFGEEPPLDEGRLLEAVRQIDPVQHRRLARLAERDPAAYQALLRRIERRLARVARDPEALARVVEIRRINQELSSLRDRYLAASGDEQVAIRAQMVTKALSLMELKQAERRARLREMQERLDKLQQEVDRREASKDRLVDEYVDSLLRPRP